MIEGVNILIVDDEENIRNLLGTYLKKEGFIVFNASNGREAIDIVNNQNINLIILDLMMPIMNGFETIKIIREKYDMPVIMLSAKEEEEDKLLALGFGADNYETKPFSPKVLVAKVKAMLRRTFSEEGSMGKEIIIEELSINEESHRVVVNNQDISLSPTEFSLLMYLVKNKNIVLTREQILTHIWGYDFEGDSRVVDTTVKRLREKLKEMSKLIVTVRGFGYKIEV